MKCPRDGVELARVEILGMVLDKCHKCDGIWCDHEELDKLRDSKIEGIEEALERKYGDPEYKDGQPEGYMRCPKCGGRLMRQSYTYGNPVSIDRCRECFGVWLDDGELDAIVGTRKELERIARSPRLKAFLKAVEELIWQREGKNR